MISNTTNNEPFVNLMTTLPGGIEAQEAQGQRELVASSQLPADGIAAVAAALGIQVIGPSARDSLFVDAKLPEGWKVQPSGHSMWSHVVDANGIQRASIFYKAAFYDRRAFIRLEK